MKSQQVMSSRGLKHKVLTTYILDGRNPQDIFAWQSSRVEVMALQALVVFHDCLGKKICCSSFVCVDAHLHNSSQLYARWLLQVVVTRHQGFQHTNAAASKQLWRLQKHHQSLRLYTDSSITTASMCGLMMCWKFARQGHACSK